MEDEKKSNKAEKQETAGCADTVLPKKPHPSIHLISVGLCGQ